MASGTQSARATSPVAGIALLLGASCGGSASEDGGISRAAAPESETQETGGDGDESMGPNGGGSGGSALAETGGHSGGTRVSSGGALAGDGGEPSGIGGDEPIENMGGAPMPTGGASSSGGTGGSPDEIVCTGEIYEGHLRLMSQADVEAFAGIAEITGNLLIDDDSQTPITSLRALSCLTRAGAEDWGGPYPTGLFIQNNPELTSLTGLSRLSHVNVDLAVLDNRSLVDAGNFSALESIYGHLTFIQNPKLEDLSGLSSLTSLVGHLRIDDNDSLTHLDGLSSLVSVGELYIYGNELLTNVDMLAQLGAPPFCWIAFNPSLAECEVELLNAEWGITCDTSNNDEVGSCAPADEVND